MKKSITINTYSSLDKIFSQDGAMYEPQFSGSMLVGSVYNFQISVFSKEYNGKAFLECEKYDGLTVKIYNVTELEATREHGNNSDDYVLSRPNRLYPELLTASYEAVLEQSKHTTFFVSVTADNTSNKINKLIFSLQGCNGELLGQTEYSLEVISTDLADNDLMVTHWMHYDCIAEAHDKEIFSDEFYTILDKYLKAYTESGSNMLLVPIFTPALDTAVGAQRMTAQLVKIKRQNGIYTFDFSDLDKFIDFALARKIKYFEFAHLFTQWGAEFCPKIVAEENGKLVKIFGWENASDGEEYTSFLKSFLPALYNYTIEKKISQNCYYHMSDEPVLENLPKYLKLYNTVKSIVPQITIIDALSNFEFYLNKAVDLPVVATNHAQIFLDNNVEHIPYYCCVQCVDYVSNRFFAMPSERNRIIGVQLYLNNARGFLHWGFNFYNTQYSKMRINPYEETSAGKAFASGDSFIVYPKGEDVKKSIRLMTFREAIEDYKALKTLERLKGRDYVTKIIESYNINGYKVYPHSAEKLIELIEKINSEIKKAQ